MDTINVVCYDIQYAILERIRQAASYSNHINIIASYDYIEDFFNEIPSLSNLDVIITGLLWKGGCSIALLEKIRKIRPNSIIIIYTIIESSFITERLIASGANKVIHKRVAGQKLIKEVLAIVEEHNCKKKN